MLKLYNSLSSSKDIFTPIDKNSIKMYVCGPTVYDKIHVGNARPLVVFDVLYRILLKLYPKVVYVTNITDIDDKIIARAIEKNYVDIFSFTQSLIDDFKAHMKVLNCKEPTYQPQATDFINQMQEIIAILIKKNYAYVVDGNVFFNVKNFTSYGKLSGMNQDGIGENIRITNLNTKKYHSDFALWKKCNKDDHLVKAVWDSPWGKGRPGWHIECSAMAQHYLGDKIDIHGGGKDLLFPHHENERAQSVACCGGDEFANYWLHNGFISVNKEKMSKSLNNFMFLSDLLDKYNPITIRFWLLSTHYRQNLDFSQLKIDEINKILSNLFNILADNINVPVDENIVDDDFNKYIFDDLNTGGSMSILYKNFENLKKSTTLGEKIAFKSKIFYCGEILGIDFSSIEKFTNSNDNKSKLQISQQEIIDLIDQRNKAKAEKNYTKADEIRDLLEQNGVVLQDSATGVKWYIK